MRKILSKIVKPINFLLRKLVYLSHGLQHKLEWQGDTTPEWYDHYLDLYFSWQRKRQPFWVERGTFGLLCIEPGARVLELCCGDGFNTRNFYSHRAKSIKALDFDTTAISHARCYNSHNNIEYIQGDIRTQIPEGPFDNIVWDAAIEHFTEEETAKIMKTIKSRLTSTGIISGYTLVEKEDGEKHPHQHEYEFKSKEDLVRFFTPHFKNVKVFETIYPERHNLYFFASDSVLPFDKNWPHVSHTQS
jgi:SAM-dependent methyltransferase